MTEPTGDTPAQEIVADPTAVETSTPQAEPTDWKAEARKWEDRAKAKSGPLKDLAAKEAEIEELRAKLAAQNQTAEEQALEQARRQARSEATAKANERVLKSEMRAAATAKLADPTDVLVYLSLKDFAVSEDGEVDADQISAAIDDLITRKPYLAKQAAVAPQPKPDASQGARPKTQTVEDAEYEQYKAKLWPTHQAQ